MKLMKYNINNLKIAIHLWCYSCCIIDFYATMNQVAIKPMQSRSNVQSTKEH